MKIIDVHAHYYDEAYKEDFDEILNQMRKSGVDYIINASASIEEAKQCLELSKKYDEFYTCIGIHPENVDNVTNEDLLKLETLIKENINNRKFVGIGEVGLDYHYTKDNIEKQKDIFKFQIELAKKYDLPLVIHSRDASQDTLEILKSVGLPKRVMFHCFDLNEQTARYIIENNISVSMGGNITYKRKESAIKVIKEMPLELIMSETDAPYLSPEPKRGKINNSTNIKYVIEKISEIKNIEIQQVEKTLYNNAIDFFKL